MIQHISAAPATQAGYIVAALILGLIGLVCLFVLYRASLLNPTSPDAPEAAVDVACACRTCVLAVPFSGSTTPAERRDMY